MIAQQSPTDERCTAYLQDLHERIADRFARSEARDRAKRYLTGLLEEVSTTVVDHLAMHCVVCSDGAWPVPDAGGATATIRVPLQLSGAV